MSEEQQYQGDRWTTQSANILKKLGWNQIGDSNFDIECVNKVAHKTKTRDRSNPHGIDILFSFYDPYKNQEIGVIVESKYRKWDGINESSIESFVIQLQTAIECAGSNKLIQGLGSPIVKTGLLMIWCNEPSLYKEDKYREYLRGLKISSRRNQTITIYIASNTEILKWCSLIQHIDSIKQENNVSEFKIFYPSDFYSGGKASTSRRDHINLVHLFSSYIFAKSKECISVGKTTSIVEVNHVFFFDEPTLDELNFMYSCIQPFQLEDASELRIHLYNDNSNFRNDIEQFLRERRKNLNSQGSQLDINISYINKLANVPANYNK